jgi:hypothetical protein
MRHARRAARHAACANRASALGARDLSGERDAQSNAVVVRRAPRGAGARRTNVDGGCLCRHCRRPRRNRDHRKDRGRDDSARRRGDSLVRAREVTRVTAGLGVDCGLRVRGAVLAARLESRPRHPGTREITVSGGDRGRQKRHGGHERPSALPPSLLPARSRSHGYSTLSPLRERRQPTRAPAGHRRPGHRLYDGGLQRCPVSQS